MGLTRILLLDPDDWTRRSVAEALPTKAYDVVVAATAGDALRLAATQPPDAILLAPGIPGLDLSGFVRTVRTHPDTALVPIVFLAAKADVEDAILGFKLGCDEFVPKPFTPRDLEVHVAVALKMRDKTETALRPRGSGSDDFSTVGVLTAFRGTLDQVGLPTLLTLFDMERKTGMLVLVLDPDREKIRLTFHDGRVLRAVSDSRPHVRNAELVYELLGRTQGKFDFRLTMVDAKDEIHTPTMRLLLEGARLLDESRRRGDES
jgi:CheY-like chemotaxis protein